jgi:phospholipid/cholesterol/gamma-HCH transport system substrate-binding protein
MSKSRLEWTVGLFVIVCLAVLAGLLIEFGKGTAFWKKTYDVEMRAPNANGLKIRAGVLMAGVQIGSVSGVRLGSLGTDVMVSLAIDGKFKIPTNSDFSIEASGFLGDQYVSVTPRVATNQPNSIEYLTNGAVVVAVTPWTFVGAANRVMTSLANFDEAAGSLKETVEAIHKGALTPETLSNFSATVSNLKQASAQATITLSNLDVLIVTNGPAIHRAGIQLDNTLSNANTLVLSVEDLVATNRASIDLAISNLQSATYRLDMLMANIDRGEGLAGKLLKDEKMAAKMSEIVTDLSVTSSNLNQLGLWRVLFPKHPKEQKRSSPSNDTRKSPKDRSD